MVPTQPDAGPTPSHSLCIENLPDPNNSVKSFKNTLYFWNYSSEAIVCFYLMCKMFVRQLSSTVCSKVYFTHRRTKQQPRYMSPSCLQPGRCQYRLRHRHGPAEGQMELREGLSVQDRCKFSNTFIFESSYMCTYT